MSLARRILGPEFNQLFRWMEEPFMNEGLRGGHLMRRRHSPYDQTLLQPMWTRGILMDMKETKQGYDVEAELPGVQKEDIKIECKDDRTLLVSGHFGTKQEPAPVREPKLESDGVVPSGAEKEARGQASQQTKEAVAQAENMDDQRYWNSERTFGEFQRSITFPSPIQTDKIKASFRNGLLSIFLPKIEKKGVTIPIEG